MADLDLKSKSIKELNDIAEAAIAERDKRAEAKKEKIIKAFEATRTGGYNTDYLIVKEGDKFNYYGKNGDVFDANLMMVEIE